MPQILSDAELIAIIERNFESKGLDYKGPMAWNTSDRAGCCALVKDVMAMANTEGGYLVIGVSETDCGFSPVGLSSEQLKSFDSTKLSQFIQNYSDPPINVLLHKVQHQQKSFVVIQVPKFPETPHICQKDFPEILRERELYVRTDNNESAALKSSADFRNLIETAIRNKSDAMLGSMRAILVGSENQSRTPTAEQQFDAQINLARASFASRDPLKEKAYSLFTETVFMPVDFDQYRFRVADLQGAVSGATTDFFGWPFLFYYPSRQDVLSVLDDGLESLIQWQDFAQKDVLDYWRLFESGLFYTRRLTPQSASQPPIVHAGFIASHCAMAICTLSRLYHWLLEDSEVISIAITLHGTRRRSLVWPEISWSHLGSYTANLPSVTVSEAWTLAEWRAGSEDIAVETTKKFMGQFNLKNPDEDRLRQEIRRVLRCAQ